MGEGGEMELLFMLLSSRMIAAGFEHGGGGGMEECTSAFVMAMPTEIDFEASQGTQDVESVTIFGSSMMGEPLDVELHIASDDGGSVPFEFWDARNHCVLVEEGVGQTCIISLDGMHMPVIPIVYTPDQTPGNTFDVGWIHVSWFEGEVECEGPVIMLDGEVE